MKRGDFLSVGDNLRLLRKSKGITQFELGDSIGVTQQAVQQYEKGYMVLSISLLIKICHVLECTPNDILGFDRKNLEK